MKNQNNQMGQKINSVIFLICIFLAPIMFFVTPKNSVSQNEKRKLSTLPIFTINKWISGTYTDSVEAYISDNFILRNKLLTWAEWSNSLKGMVDDEVVFISPQKNKPNKTERASALKPTIKDSANLHSDSLNIDTGKYAVKHIINEKEDFDIVNSIILYKKRAIMIFSGSKNSANNYAAMVNMFKNKLPQLNVYCMAIPCGSDFFLPSMYNKNRKAEKEFIDYFYSKRSEEHTSELQSH